MTKLAQLHRLLSKLTMKGEPTRSRSTGARRSGSDRDAVQQYAALPFCAVVRAASHSSWHCCGWWSSLDGWGGAWGGVVLHTAGLQLCWPVIAPRMVSVTAASRRQFVKQ
jgi:hypothetical protein